MAVLQTPVCAANTYVLIQALLYQKYSVHSDVWSYVCVLYEIWSIGHIPFGDITGSAVCTEYSKISIMLLNEHNVGSA